MCASSSSTENRGSCARLRSALAFRCRTILRPTPDLSVLPDYSRVIDRKTCLNSFHEKAETGPQVDSISRLLGVRHEKNLPGGFGKFHHRRPAFTYRAWRSLTVKGALHQPNVALARKDSFMAGDILAGLRTPMQGTRGMTVHPEAPPYLALPDNLRAVDERARGQLPSPSVLLCDPPPSPGAVPRWCAPQSDRARTPRMLPTS